jgi:hypothetical protein
MWVDGHGISMANFAPKKAFEGLWDVDSIFGFYSCS